MKTGADRQMMKQLLRCGIVCVAMTAALLIPVQAGADESPTAARDTEIGTQIYSAILELRNGETENFSELLDMESLVDSVLDGLDLQGSEEAAFRNGAVFQKSAMVTNFAVALSQALSVTHLKSSSGPSGIKVLIRIDFGTQGLNFHEYLVNANTGKIIDWYDFVLGRNASENMQSFALPLIGPQTLSARFRSLFDDSGKHADSMEEMVEALQKKEYKNVVGAYRRAPESFQSTDPALTMLIMATTTVNDPPDYEYALDQVARYGADDPRYAFMLIDYFFVRGEYEKSIDAVEVIQARLGVAEAGLEELKAGIHSLQGDNERAIAAYKKASEIEPDREESYGMLFELYAMSDKHAAAQDMLDILNDRFGYGLSPEDFADDPDLEGYVNWSRSR